MAAANVDALAEQLGKAKVGTVALTKSDQFREANLSYASPASIVPGIGTEAAEKLKGLEKRIELPKIDKAVQLFGLYLLLGQEEFNKVVKEITDAKGANITLPGKSIARWLDEHGLLLEETKPATPPTTPAKDKAGAPAA